MAGSDEVGLRVGEPGFEYWAPELRELHVRLPLQAVPVGGEERFKPLGVLLDGEKPRYAFWYVDGTAYAYWWVENASHRKLELFVPLPWRPGRQHTLTLTYSYAGRETEQAVTVDTPQAGGVWEASDGGNYAFLVREQAGMARRGEPVEFELTERLDVFADPERTVRATVMVRPGEFREIPCQVYDVEHCEPQGTYVSVPLVRFRAAVQLSLGAGEEALVILWNCPGKPSQAAHGVRLDGSALGGALENDCCRVELDAKSGQLGQWHDKRINVEFYYCSERTRGRRRPMSYTPDVYRVGEAWAHTDEWDGPRNSELRGPVFCETARWGEMRKVPEVTSRVTYRLYANRPELRLSSVTRVLKDINVLGFRNGGMIQSPRLYTHAAWPAADGSIVRLPVEKCLGNDTGATPRARMPFDTPWVAFYHKDKKYGLATITAKQHYFNTGTHQPNMSNAQRYVSLYNHRFLYTVRCMNFTYCSGIRSYHTPMHAGTMACEEEALLPFTFEREDDAQFEQVEALLREMLNPLVVVP